MNQLKDMRCMKSELPARRTIHTPVVFSRPQPRQNTPPPPVAKTKYALAFLCLFDGLRTPSIRRLVRKPRTVCKKPLLTFDPSFYAPSTQNSLQETYANFINCPCESAVDPSVATVLSLLRRHTTSMPPQRVILHYFGHGSHPPTADGCLFFFSDDRARYKPLKIQNITNACSCPLCFILDCPFAAIVKPLLATKSDLFAFFACGEYELLPLSTDVPMDMFSSCLLRPFDTALTWHMRQPGSVYREQRTPGEEHLGFLREFFYACLDAIIFDTQTPANVEAFMRDPSIASLMRGFVLAQRVMLSFNLHPVSLPEVKNMANHPLWEMWDVVLDFAITMSKDEAPKMVFDLFIASFKRFPKAGYFPIFSFLLKRDEFHQETADVLFKYLDDNDDVPAIAARSNIPRTIVELMNPSPTSLMVLAKIIASGLSSPFDQHTPVHFSTSSNPKVIANGMLALCCSIAGQSGPSFNRLALMCVENAVDCAPYSAILLSLIVDRAGKLMTIPEFETKFLPLLTNEREDVRAATAFLLSNSSNPIVVAPLVQTLGDESPLVRIQALLALVQVMKIIPQKPVFRELEKLEKDRHRDVRVCYGSLKHIIRAIEEDNNNEALDSKQECEESNLLSLLVQSVKRPKFVERVSNVFKLNIEHT